MATMHHLTSNVTNVEMFAYTPKEGVGERHIMIHATKAPATARQQIENVLVTYHKLLSNELKGFTPVFRRIFLSDAANQIDLVENFLKDEVDEVATSVVEQAPLDGSKVALWAYFVEGDLKAKKQNGLHVVSHSNYSHYWGGTTCLKDGNSEEQTYRMLHDYANQLTNEGLTLKDDCIRTWFFVQNVDVNYQGVVDGRNRLFAEHDLTPSTHFITSTGIGGRNADKNEIVQMNTYAVKGLKDGQVNFLYAKDYLNPTYEYGVSFERGTYVDYGDRRQVFISGTASIDNKGNVMHVGEIDKQVERMWQNVDALLKEANCGFEDVAQMLVYLRDTADYELVKAMFEQRFPNTPKVFLLAPVCRPTWLIEMECIAVKEMHNAKFANF